MTNLSYKEVVQFAAHRLTKTTIKKESFIVKLYPKIPNCIYEVPKVPNF
jgi:hypothetical protein